MSHPTVAVVVPTFKEAGNIRALVERLDRVRAELPGGLELVIVDDDSGDGTREIVEALREAPGGEWIRLNERVARRGLSTAVLEGFQSAEADVYVVMDADLSHPPEAIPSMVELVWRGDEQGPVGMALGSRYVAGGSTAEGWGPANRLNSIIATALARPFTSVRDPMSGFFAIRKDVLHGAESLQPIGYKIGLELMVRCPVGRVVEVPIHFATREAGRSKTTWRQRLLYLKHLRRLALFRYPERWMLFHFALVGSIGVVVNLVIVTLLTMGGVGPSVAVPVAVVGSMLGNFFLNRRFSFPSGRQLPVLRPLVRFVASCATGMAINIVVTLLLVRAAPELPIQLPALAGILAGLTSNYLLTRIFVFPDLPRPD